MPENTVILSRNVEPFFPQKGFPAKYFNSSRFGMHYPDMDWYAAGAEVADAEDRHQGSSAWRSFK